MKKLLCFLFLGAAFALNVNAAEKPQPVTVELSANIVKNAPDMPAELNHGLNLKLIDFVDCTDPKDPHGFMDQGTSKLTSGPAGKYRITAAHRHAFFSYMHKTAGKDNPIFIVIEYPDDAVRLMSFMTHDSNRPGGPHLSFSLEGGVYTGEPLPLTNKMQYFTYISWPQDKWTPLLIENFMQSGSSGAASRIWVYEIAGGLPELKLEAPVPGKQRVLDMFFPLAFLATRDYFGRDSKRSVEHMLEYCKYVGINRVTMMVYANQDWGAMCTVPSWDTDDKGYLDDILKTMDAKGGVELLAGVVAVGMYGTVKSKGKDVKDMKPEELKEVILKGFGEFIEKYGKYKSLKGVTLGSLETIGFYNLLEKAGIVKDVVGFIKKKRPDWEVVTYVGNKYLQEPYFDGNTIQGNSSPDMVDIISKWEKEGGSWTGYLAREVAGCLKSWKNEPAEMKKIDGLTVYEMFYPDDHRVHYQYTFQPRAGVYYDVDRSQPRSDNAGSKYGGVFSTFNEGWTGLMEGINFWYRKDWTGPDFNPPLSMSLASLGRVIAHNDRLGITQGTWNVKYFGMETAVRRFAKAFRSLPPETLQDVAGVPDTFKVRWLNYKQKRYISIQSKVPFASEISIDGKIIKLPPYELVTLTDSILTEPKVTVPPCADYKSFVENRVKDYEKAYTDLKAIKENAAPEVYLEPLKDAKKLFGEGKLYSADIALGFGLEKELALRKDILKRPEVKAAKVTSSFELNGNLDNWPKSATDITAAGGEYLAGHVFFPNSWTGPKDLSIRLRLCHDGKTLYIGLEVKDDVLDKTDGCELRFSSSNYMNLKSKLEKWDYAWQIAAPLDKEKFTGEGKNGFKYTCYRTQEGYLVEGTAPLSEMNLSSGESIGFQVSVSDRDKQDNLMSTKKGNVREIVGWARKQNLLYPYKPNFAFWQDARGLGTLNLEK